MRASSSWIVFAATAAALVTGCGARAEHAPPAEVVEQAVSAAAAVTGPVVGDWGEPVAGIRTRITAIDEAWAVGRPLRIRLEVENVTAGEIAYTAQQVDSNEPFLVTGPDGQRVGWVGTVRQSTGPTRSLAAGAGITLVAGLDLADDYLLHHPGAYTIASRAHRGFPSWPGGAIPGVPASAAITIVLGPGEVAASRRLMEQLLARLPATGGSWRVERHPETGAVSDIYVVFLARDARPPMIGRPAGADGSIRATLGFRRSAPEGDQPEELGVAGDRLEWVGPLGQVHVYLRTREDLRRAWPTIVTDVRAAVAAAH